MRRVFISSTNLCEGSARSDLFAVFFQLTTTMAARSQQLRMQRASNRVSSIVCCRAGHGIDIDTRYGGPCSSSPNTRRRVSSSTGLEDFDRYSLNASLISDWYPRPALSARSLNCARTSSSRRIVIRVLPRCGITAPRLPLLKSYSFVIQHGFSISEADPVLP